MKCVASSGYFLLLYAKVKSWRSGIDLNFVNDSIRYQHMRYQDQHVLIVG